MSPILFSPMQLAQLRRRIAPPVIQRRIGGCRVVRVRAQLPAVRTRPQRASAAAEPAVNFAPLRKACETLLLPEARDAGQTSRPGVVPATPYRNFLIIAAPKDRCDAEDRFATAIARYLMADGFVYVLAPDQPTTEDDEWGVRHMPLRETLPYFGVMTAVILINQPAWAAAATAAYPDAQVYTLGAAPGIPAPVSAVQAMPCFCSATATA